MAQELHSRGPQHVEMSPQMYGLQNLDPLRAFNDDQHNVQQLLGSINSSLNPEQCTSCVTLEEISAVKLNRVDLTMFIQSRFFKSTALPALGHVCYTRDWSRGFSKVGLFSLRSFGLYQKF